MNLTEQQKIIAQCLQADGVIAYPTEGVWGLGCLPESKNGVDKILRLKDRSWTQGLLLVAAHQRQFSDYLQDLTSAQLAELDQAWPGHTTFLVPHGGTAQDWIAGEHDTIGLRVTDHPVVIMLTEAFGPLVSTSANPSGEPPAMTADQVRAYFGDEIDYIVEGELGGATGPSTIRHIGTGDTIR